MLGIGGKVLSWPTNRQVLTVVLKNCKKPAVKHCKKILMLLNFVDVSTIFYPRLSEETYFHF